MAKGRALRAALTVLPPAERDRWFDQTLGLGDPPDDVLPLPLEAVPYVPCPVDALLRMVDEAPIRPSDVFLDLGAGIGRALLFVHLLTGARAQGVELQPHLVALGRAHCERLGVEGVALLEGNAADHVPEASVVLLYSPFNGDTLRRVRARLEPLGARRAVTVCAVDCELDGLAGFDRRASSSPAISFYDARPGGRG